MKQERSDPQYRDQNGNSYVSYEKSQTSFEGTFIGFDHRGFAIFHNDETITRALLNRNGSLSDVQERPSYSPDPREHVRNAVEKHGRWWFVVI